MWRNPRRYTDSNQYPLRISAAQAVIELASAKKGSSYEAADRRIGAVNPFRRQLFRKRAAIRLPSPKEQAAAIAVNSPVEVKFLDGSKKQGWISEVSDAGFVLSHEKNRQIEKAQVGFAQVETVKQIKEVKPSHKTRNIFIGVGIVFGALEHFGRDIACSRLLLVPNGGYRFSYSRRWP